MSDRRTSRLNEQFKREISIILSGKVRDHRIGRILVTGVRVTPDLWMARIFIRSLDEDRNMDEVMQGLAAAAPFIRKELGRGLSIRRIPELRFLHDDTMDSAQRIEDVLKEVLPESEESEESEEAGEAVEAGEGEDDGSEEEGEAPDATEGGR